MIFVHGNLEKLHNTPEKMCHWSLYCICDGHGGQDAAMYLKEHLGRDLVQRLPLGNPPSMLAKGARKLRIGLDNLHLNSCVVA